MRLIEQFRVTEKNLPALDWSGSNNPQTGQMRVRGINVLMTSVRALRNVPALESAANVVLVNLPYSTNEQIEFSHGVFSNIKQSIDALRFKAQLLTDVLRPLVSPEDESTLYVDVPHFRDLKDLGSFTESLTRNLDQIFTKKISSHFSLAFEGVEKGSDWLILSLLVDGAKANAPQILAFIEFILLCAEYFQKYEDLKKLIDFLRGKTPEEQKRLEDAQKPLIANMQEVERDSLIEKILAIAPLNEGSKLDAEDVVRIGNSAYELGKTFTEETQIEVSGLIETRTEKEISTKVEKLRIIKTRKVSLLQGSTRNSPDSME